MHKLIVDEKRWIGEERFLHALNYCTLLPGPEAQQLATYIGWLLHGTRGGLTAGLLFIVPGALAILALSIIYMTLGHVPLIAGIFLGLKAAVMALVVEAVLRVGRRALRSGMAAFGCERRVPGAVRVRVAVSTRRHRRWRIRLLLDACGSRGLRRRCARQRSHRRTYAADRRCVIAPRTGGRGSRVSHSRAVAAVVVRANRARGALARIRAPLCAHRNFLRRNGRGDVRRRVRGARLCRATRGRRLRLALESADARRTRVGRNHAGTADSRRAVRRVRRRVSGIRNDRRHRRRTHRPVGHVRAVLPVDLPRRALRRIAAASEAACRRARRNHRGCGRCDSESRAVVRVARALHAVGS